jgi:hypothetical protein
MARILKLDMKVRKDGDVWRILSLGRDDHPDYPGEVYCHLASTTRFRQQKNGPYPIQICVWVKGRVKV